MAAGWFRGPSRPPPAHRPSPGGNSGHFGRLGFGFIRPTFHRRTSTSISPLLTTTLLCLPEAPAAKRQSLCLPLLPSIWLATKKGKKKKKIKKILKVERLGSKQPSPDDNNEEQKSCAWRKKTTALRTYLEKTTIRTAGVPAWSKATWMKNEN